MKEKLYTIPLMDAYRAGEECPFCYIQRELEQHAMDFTLGSGASYMEDDIRAQTDEKGFCREHYRQMFAYGNRLGTALILETHLKKVSKNLQEQMDHFSAGRKGSFLDRFKKNPAHAGEDAVNNVSAYIRAGQCSCFICEQISENYERYLVTFIDLFKKQDPDFIRLVEDAKGYCLPHFGDLLTCADKNLNENEQKKLREIIFPQMQAGLEKLIGDVEWFQNKFDYRFKDAPWKDSQDAVQRGMQKLGSGYPADPPYIQK